MRGPTNPPAIVIGGEAIAVPVVRSLANAGVEVHAAGGDPAYDPAGWSRHCRSYTDLGSPEGVVDRMLDWLLHDSPRGAVLMPCNDDGLELVLRHRDELVGAGHVPPEAKPELLKVMLDKEKTYALAGEAGIPAPRTRAIAAGADVDRAIEEIGFPCAVKPRHANRWAVHFNIQKLVVAEDRAALEQVLEKTADLGLETIVTEIIPGPETQLLSYAGYLDENGEPLSQFTFRKYRQLPVHFGIGTYVVSDWNEEVIEAGLGFLRAAGLRGLFHVEFKRDARDGELKLLECNHRFTIESSFAPVDLPLLAYNRVLDRPPPPPRRYRSGVHLWEPYRDLRALLAYRRRGELSVAGWLRTLLHRQRFHAFAWSDPRPALDSRLVLGRRWLGKRRRRRHGLSEGPRPSPARRRAIGSLSGDRHGAVQIDPADPRWDDYVRRHPRATANHLGAWARILSESHGFKPRYLALESRDGDLEGVLPLVYARGVMSGARLSSLPALRWAGPLADSSEAEARLITAARDLVETGKARRLGLLTAAGGYEELVEDLERAEAPPTWRLRLPDDPEAYRRALKKRSKSCFYNVKQSWNRGVTVREGRSEADLRAFYGFYLGTMRRHTSLPRPYRMLSLAAESFGPEVSRLYVAEVEGRPVAGLICHYFNGTVEVMYQASDPRHLELHPNHALYDHAIRAAIAEGYAGFDFGGAWPHESLADFKRRWGSEPVPRFSYVFPATATSSGGAAALASAQQHTTDGAGTLAKAWGRVPLPLTRVAGELVWRFA